MPVEVATMTDLQVVSADLTKQIAALQTATESAIAALAAKIDESTMPQEVKDAMKIVLNYYLTKITT